MLHSASAEESDFEQDEHPRLEALGARYMVARPGRISGTALPLGVHLSNGAYGTASSWHLMLGGAYIISIGAVGMIVTYLEAWIVYRLFGVPLPAMLLGVAGVLSDKDLTYWSAALNVLPFVNFILILRMSALSGYHAAEHKVVGAIERFGHLRYDDIVEMPRVHPRCGTVLLFGLLPALLVLAGLAPTMLPPHPQWHLNALIGVLIALVGWNFRYHTGYFVQNHFTTKPPTPAQLQAGSRAGQALLARWQQDPDRRVPWLRSIWIRGLPQMLIGLFLASRLMGYIYANLHIWLDF